MLVSFMFAVIAVITITLKHIEPIAPAESSLVETIVTEITTTSHTTGYTSTLTTTETTSRSTSSITTTESITSSTTEYETTYTTTKDDIIVVTGYQIIVIPDETTKTAKTTAITTTYSVTTITTTTTVGITVKDDGAPNASRRFVKTFGRGTYYSVGSESQAYGGSGRGLFSCTTDSSVEIKGSIACRFIYENYGYNYNGKRTVVYLEIPQYPNMDGRYYVDDCCASSDTIDFFYLNVNDCPFQYQGVLTGISCYIVE